MQHLVDKGWRLLWSVDRLENERKNWSIQPAQGLSSVVKEVLMRLIKRYVD